MRSARLPTKGALNAYTQKKMVTPLAVAAVLHPNSCWMGVKNMPTLYLSPYMNM